MGTSSSVPANETYLNATASVPASPPKKMLPLVGKGDYYVGCADIMVENAPSSSSDNNNNNEIHSSDKVPEGLIMRVFYPVSKKRGSLSSGAVAPFTSFPNWKPDRVEYVEGVANYQAISSTKMHIFYDWLIGEKRIPAEWHASLYENLSSEEEECGEKNVITEGSLPKYPVVVFSHGISGNRFIYSTILASIASYGYVVAIIEHRDSSASWTYHVVKDPVTGATVEKPIKMGEFPYKEVEFEERNRQTHVRARELVFALKILESLNSGDLTENKENGLKIVWGNDFNWSQFKIRGQHMFKASIILDGWLFPIEDELYEVLRSPVLFLNANKWQWRENVLRMLKLRELMISKYHPFSSANFLFTLRDISHQAFSDFSVAAAGRLGKYLQLQGDLDPELTTTAIVEMSAKFLHSVLLDGQLNDLPVNLKSVSDDKRFAHFILEGTDIPIESLANEELLSNV